MPARIEIYGATWRRETGEGGRSILHRLYSLSDLHLMVEWGAYLADAEATDFRDWLAEYRLIDPDEVDDIYLCDRCGVPDPDEDDHQWVDDGDQRLCDGCVANYYTLCDDCEEYRLDNQVHGVGDRSVCGPCCDRNYSWCDECNEYMHSENSDHYDYHEGEEEDENLSSCCEAPGQSFVFPVDGGDSSILNDQQATVTLPDGIVSDEGLDAIACYLRDVAAKDEDGADFDPFGPTHPARILSHHVTGETFGTNWQTKDGNFSKRMARYAYKQWGYKVEKEHVARIGDMARTHSKGAEVEVSVTRDLNLSASAFYHGGSCWWTDYAYSRCTFKSNGGVGLRSWNDNGVSGRAWVIPLKRVPTEYAGDRLVPTFDTADAVAYVVFNGYGALDEMTAARVVAAMTGHSYSRVSVNGDWCMYINGDCWLIAPEDVIAAQGGTLTLNLIKHASLFTDEQAALLEAEEVVANV